MHRFFFSEHSLAVGAPVDLGPIRHQVTRVLRMQPGDSILLLDGLGGEYVTELGQDAEGRIFATALERRTASGEPSVHLTLYQCALKSDKMEWVLQKCTELGVSRIVPVVSERTIVRPAAKVARKADRWRTILREAAEQSRRGRIPALSEPMTWQEAVAHPDPDAVRLVAWENPNESLGLAKAVRAVTKSSSGYAVALLIGPEGGISDGEMDAARAQGWHAVTLGPRILRAETAALAAVSIVMSELGEMA